MFENIISADNVSFIIVFIEGLVSFLSPCVIPLIPVYMSYLAGNAKVTAEDGAITYRRKKVFFHTAFFVLGISFAFFILGMSFTALGSFFKDNQLMFTRIGGILIVVFGLYQLGFFEFKFLHREKRLHINFGDKKMNPFMAFLMGFTFSFAWTPCVGPALSSVLILASGAKNSMLGNLLVLVYAVGFTIPFLLLGLFTTQVLNFLKGHQKLLKYTVKAGGLLLIIIGIMTFTGWMNGISRYLNSFTPQKSEEQMEGGEDIDESVDNLDDNDKNPENTDNNNDDSDTVPAYDFTLTDQYGNTHTLSEYKGKVVFLNFWATWCSPCRKEMPDIEEFYKKYGENQDDVIFLGVSNPYSNEYPNTKEVDKEGVIAFLNENGYTFPTVFDETGETYGKYAISSLPTTFLIDKEGNFYGYAPGMLTKDQMESAIEQTLEAGE